MYDERRIYSTQKKSFEAAFTYHKTDHHQKEQNTFSLFLLRVFWCPLIWNQIGVIIVFYLCVVPWSIFSHNLSLGCISLGSVSLYDYHHIQSGLERSFFILHFFDLPTEFGIRTQNSKSVFSSARFAFNPSIDHSFFVSIAKINCCNDLMMILCSWI